MGRYLEIGALTGVNLRNVIAIEKIGISEHVINPRKRTSTIKQTPGQFFEEKTYEELGKFDIVFLRNYRDLENRIKTCFKQLLRQDGLLIIEGFDIRRNDMWRVHAGMLKRGVNVYVLRDQYLVIQKPVLEQRTIKSGMKYDNYLKMLNNG